MDSLSLSRIRSALICSFSRFRNPEIWRNAAADSKVDLISSELNRNALGLGPGLRVRVRVRNRTPKFGVCGAETREAEEAVVGRLGLGQTIGVRVRV